MKHGIEETLDRSKEDLKLAGASRRGVSTTRTESGFTSVCRVRALSRSLAGDDVVAMPGPVVSADQ